MSRALLILLLLVLALGGVYFFFLQEDKTAVSSELIYQHAQRQGTGQLKPGWVLLDVSRSPELGTKIRHRVRVNPELAGDLLMMGTFKRRGTVTDVACPGDEDPIWEQLTSRQDIEIEMVSENGSFAVIDCRGII